MTHTSQEHDRQVSVGDLPADLMPEAEAGFQAEPDGHIEADYSADRGATTAEYAVLTLAAVGFAGLLILLLTSDDARGLLWNIISSALSF